MLGLTGSSSAPDLARRLAALRDELDLPGPYPRVTWREPDRSGYPDRTDLELVTLDPPGSQDLDQAFGLVGRAKGGWVLTYAIADVGAFVEPGSALDAESLRRGETLYLPDGRIPLHPAGMSEGAASLLPGQDRPAVLWEVAVDADGLPDGDPHVSRAIVRSRAQLDYPSAQQAVLAGTASGPLARLEPFGRARVLAGRARGALTLPAVEQEVVPVTGPAGRPTWTLALRAPLPVEDWGAQMSLLVGAAAGGLQLAAGVGLLRVLPEAASEDVAAVRALAVGLGVPWPAGAGAAEVISQLDPQQAAQAAVISAARRLLRGAGYLAVTPGLAEPAAWHAGVGAVYAHATAPLRRLGDRWVSEVCLAVADGSNLPDWVQAGLPLLPDLLSAAGSRSHAVDRAVVDLVEAAVLSGREGELFEAVVLRASATGGTAALTDLPVVCRVVGSDLPVGQRVPVRLTMADLDAREVVVEALSGSGSGRKPEHV